VQTQVDHSVKKTLAGPNVKDKHRGVSYSVVRTGAISWEWYVQLGTPTVLKTGEASSEPIALMQAHQLIGNALHKTCDQAEGESE
jgi:hypothetical protein